MVRTFCIGSKFSPVEKPVDCVYNYSYIHKEYYFRNFFVIEKSENCKHFLIMNTDL